ncbi:MAG TPA: SBBP repeat-containing protein [Chitinophagales bacterium]|nr:SBBP repeat-containing protein [Chitinophagales bacterium]HRG86961.1 SBBP repeat-containing protein [Chitinophagales bacterium]
MPDTIDYSASKVDGSGNIYVTTNTISATEKANILTTKYNSAGVVQWEVEKDNTDENDYGSAIEVDGSGNVYVGAATWVDGTNKYDYLVIKYNSSGTQQWTATYNGPGNFYDIPTDIYVDGSGNVYVTGYSYGSTTLGDFCTIKYNSSGTAQWTSRYDYALDQDAAAIVRSGPGSTVVVIGASENTPGDWDFAAVQYNASTGAQVNSNRNSASGSGFDQVYSADVDASGNIYISGRAAVVDEGFNMRTVKLDPDLDLVWAKNHDHFELDDEAHGVIVDLAENVYVTGWVTNADQTRSMLLVKYNSTGTLQWYRQMNAPTPGLDLIGLKISSVTDGNIVIAGNVDNGQSLDFMTAIYNPDGDLLWQEQYDSPDKYDDKVNFVKADVDGVFYIGGKSYGISTATNRLIKYNSASFITPPDDDVYFPSSFNYFENKGQIIDSEGDPVSDVKYYTKKHSPALFFTDDKLSYAWARIDTTEDDTLSRIDMSFVGSNVTKTIQRATSQGGEYLNYYLAHCSDGITNIRSTNRLIIPEVYNDVDLEYYFDQNGIKFYLIIKPGYSEQNDPISILFEGANEVDINGSGELVITGPLGSITYQVADAYQIDEVGDLEPLGWDAEYIQIDDFEIGFDISTYDDEMPLVIEMKLNGVAGGGGDAGFNNTWSTLYGFDGWDQLYDVATNYKTYNPSFEQPDEIIYVAGVTYNSVFPVDFVVAENIIDEFDYLVQSFWEENADFGTLGTPIWTSFLGGSRNEGNIWPEFPLFGGSIEDGTPSIAVKNFDGVAHPVGFLYLVGNTLSTDITIIPVDGAYSQPTKPNGSTDIYDGIIFKLNASGFISWSTYLGGQNGHTTITGVELDNTDNLYICGGTEGGNLFPIVDPGGSAYVENTGNAFISKFANNGEPIWSTRFGVGNGDVSAERATDLTEFDGTIAVVGRTDDDGFTPMATAYQDTYGGDIGDGFIIRFNSDYSFDWSTYIGLDKKDYLRTITHNLEGDYFIGGNSFSDANIDAYIDATLEAGGGDLWATPQGEGDALLGKFSSEGAQLWLTYYGGDNDDYISDVNFDENRNLLFVTGFTASGAPTFPINDDLPGIYTLDGTLANLSSGFISAFDSDVELIYSTFIGYEVTTWGAAIYAGPNHYYNVGYESFDKFNPGEEFKPLQEFDEFSDDDYYQDIPNSYVYELFGGLGDLDYEGYICMFDYAPFEGFGTSVSTIFLNDFSVYPNPTEGLITVVAKNIELNNLKLTNLLGQQCPINTLNISANKIVIDLNGLESGIYYLTIQDEMFTNFKIVKL